MADATPPTNPGPGRKFAELYIPHKHATTFDAPTRFKGTQPSWGAVPGAVGGAVGGADSETDGVGRPDTRNAFAENWLALERWARDLRDRVGDGAGEVGFGFVSGEGAWMSPPGEQWNILFAERSDSTTPHNSIHLGLNIPAFSGAFMDSQESNVLVGNDIAASTNDQEYELSYGNVVIGHDTMNIGGFWGTGEGNHDLEESVVIGNWAGFVRDDTDGMRVRDCVFVGPLAGGALERAGSFVGSDGVWGAVAIGSQALYGGGDESGAGGVVAIGWSAGFARNGWSNVMIGDNAGAASIAGGSLTPKEGWNITAIGWRAGAVNSDRNNVVHIGMTAGHQNGNSETISIGRGSTANSASGAENVIAFGRSTGWGNHRGNRVMIHYWDGPFVNTRDQLDELLIDGRFHNGTDAEQPDPFIPSFDYTKGVKIRGLLEVAPPNSSSSAQTELILTDANGDRKAITVDGSGNLQVGTPSGAISP